jgi:hypothetical protein
VVPEVVQRGKEAILRCHYDLEKAPLYSLKWYRGRHEFYRFSPSEEPPTKIFNISGIYVDVSCIAQRGESSQCRKPGILAPSRRATRIRICCISGSILGRRRRRRVRELFFVKEQKFTVKYFCSLLIRIETSNAEISIKWSGL